MLIKVSLTRFISFAKIALLIDACYSWKVIAEGTINNVNTTNITTLPCYSSCCLLLFSLFSTKALTSTRLHFPISLWRLTPHWISKSITFRKICPPSLYTRDYQGKRMSPPGFKPKVIPLLLDLLPSPSWMLLARCVDSPSDFLATSWDHLAGNVHIPERSESSSLINIIYIVCLRVTLYTCIYVYIRVYMCMYKCLLFDFHCTNFFCTPSRLFAGLSFALCSFGCSFFYSSFGLGEFNKQTTHDGNPNEWLCSLRYNSLFISLPFFTKQQHEKGTFCVWRCLTYSVWNIYDSDRQIKWI